MSAGAFADASQARLIAGFFFTCKSGTSDIIGLSHVLKNQISKRRRRKELVLDDHGFTQFKDSLDGCDMIKV